jgi:hypothetical protein
MVGWLTSAIGGAGARTQRQLHRSLPRGVEAALRGGDLIAEWPKVDRGWRGFSPEVGRGGEQLLDGLRWQLPSSEHNRWRAAVLELL